MELRKRIFILGTTDYSFMIHTMIEQEGHYEIIGHTVSKDQVSQNSEKCREKGTLLFAFEELEGFVEHGESVNVINTIGYSNMNQTREKMYAQCMELGYISINYVSSRSICLSEMEGNGNVVLPGAYIGTNVKVGNDNVIYSGVVLTHDICVGSHNFFAANSTVGGCSTIGDNCFIGMGAVIRNRLAVSDFTLIGAGGYLDTNTESEDVVVPPRSVKLNKKSREVNLIPKGK